MSFRAAPRSLCPALVLASASFAAAIAGCTNGHTAVVQLQTDLVPGLEFDEVFVQATGLRSRRVNLRDDYGRPVQIAEIGHLAAGSDVSVEVSLRRDGTEVVSRRVQHHIQADTILGVIITRNCIEIACPAPGSPTATECRDGLCVPPDCEEEGSCVTPECDRDSDCSSSIACVAPRCAFGVCLETPDATRCRSDEICSPVEGCLAAAIPDAGAPDAFLGVDASAEPDVYTPPVDAYVPVPGFTLRFLPTGGSAWTVITPHGDFPTEPVEAVFAPAGTSELVVLTRTELFVFDRTSWTFTERRSRDAVFPALSGVYLADAYSVGTSLLVSGASSTHETWQYTWDHTGRTASLDRYIPAADLGADWHGPLTPPWWEGIAAFFVPHNGDGWATPDSSLSPCGAAPIDAYVGILSWDGFGPAAMTVALYDGGCSQFVRRGIYGAEVYPPFGLPGASRPFDVQAMEWADGLWVFSAPD